MTSFCSKCQPHRRGHKCMGIKELFAAVCLLTIGLSIVTLAPRVLIFIKASPFPIQQETSGHIREQESATTDPKPGVNRAIGNTRAEGQDGVKSSKGLSGLSQHMKQQVEFIRDAIKEAHYRNLPLADEPKCTGNLIKGEVEDLLCIPRPSFIKEVRNPCWWSNVGRVKRLRCIPFFHILGCEKCGSSDLWDRITSHPHTTRINGIHDKEANWWGWARYGRFHYMYEKVTPFISGYTSHFLGLTKQVEQSLKNGRNIHKYLVTGDGTPSDLMDFRGWVNITQNRGRKLPHVITPHLMKHIYPETTKFIVILRDPIERLYSDFCYAGGGKTAKDFHLNLLGIIDKMADCIRLRSVHECFFDTTMYLRRTVRFHLILYTLYIKEWLKVFPRERFLFLRTEDYAKDTYNTVKICYEFLGLEPLSDEALGEIAKQPHSLTGPQKETAGPMWRSTKDILEEIVTPSMHFLPELLQDNRFVWDFNLTPVVEPQDDVSDKPGSR